VEGEEEDDDDDDDDVGEIGFSRYGKQPFLGTLTVDEIGSLLLDVKLDRQGVLEFKADTGADATVMGKEHIEKVKIRSEFDVLLSTFIQ